MDIIDEKRGEFGPKSRNLQSCGVCQTDSHGNPTGGRLQAKKVSGRVKKERPVGGPPFKGASQPTRKAYSEENDIKIWRIYQNIRAIPENRDSEAATYCWGW